MFPVWQDIGFFKSTGERVANHDQARAILKKKKKRWLSKLEIEVIKRRIIQEDMSDINVQGLENATTHENAEDDEILQNEGNSTFKVIVEVIVSEILELS